MTKPKLIDIVICVLIIMLFFSLFMYVQIVDWEDAIAQEKQTCIESHLHLNKTKTFVLCGKVATL